MEKKIEIEKEKIKKTQEKQESKRNGKTETEQE